MDNINTIQELMNKLNTLSIDSTEVFKKELEDYLREKEECGLIMNGKITFKDFDDLEYFKKLANKCGLNAFNLLNGLHISSIED